MYGDQQNILICMVPSLFHLHNTKTSKRKKYSKKKAYLKILLNKLNYFFTSYKGTHDAKMGKKITRLL